MPRPASRHKSDFGASAWSDEALFWDRMTRIWGGLPHSRLRLALEHTAKHRVASSWQKADMQANSSCTV